MDIHKPYKEKLDAQLKEWNAQINLLEAKLENMGADMRLKRAEELEALRTKQHAAAEKMKELAQASGEAWEHAKVSADKMWADMKAGINEISKKF